MAVSYMDYTAPNVQFFFDVNTNRAFTTNDRNYINKLGYQQLNTLGNASILDIFFSKGHYVEPHYHQNATELVYCVSGAVTVSFINPFTNKLIVIPIKPGQVANIPQGWWHYEEATEDGSHVIAIFDAPTPEVILGSDILRLTPTRAMAETYCLDEAKWKEAIAPITKTVGIGPLDDCNKKGAAATGKRGEEPAAQPPYPNPYAYPAAPGYSYPAYGGGNPNAYYAAPNPAQFYPQQQPAYFYPQAYPPSQPARPAAAAPPPSPQQQRPYAQPPSQPQPQIRQHPQPRPPSASKQP